MGKRHGRRGAWDSVVARLRHPVIGFGRHWWRQHGEILDSLDQCRMADIVLLYCMIRAQRKEGRTLAIIRQGPNPIDRRNGLTRDVFRPDVPDPRLTKSRQHIRDSGVDGVVRCTYPSEYCRILPFLDHANQFRPDSTLSLRFKIRIVLGDSAVGGFETLHTRRSPSDVCVANMSDFCLVEDACHDRFTIGDGARGVVNVCKIVKAGCSATIKMEPFKYLPPHQQRHASRDRIHRPNSISLTVRRRRQGCDRVEDGTC